MYLMLDEGEVRELLSSLKKDKGNEYFLCKKLENTLKEKNEIIGETHVTWIVDDVIQKWNDRYDSIPSRETVDTFIESYIDGLDDVGSESAIQCGWDVIYNAFDAYEKDMEGK